MFLKKDLADKFFRDYYKIRCVFKYFFLILIEDHGYPFKLGPDDFWVSKPIVLAWKSSKTWPINLDYHTFNSTFNKCVNQWQVELSNFF